MTFNLAFNSKLCLQYANRAIILSKIHTSIYEKAFLESFLLSQLDRLFIFIEVHPANDRQYKTRDEILKETRNTSTLCVLQTNARATWPNADTN